MITLIKRKSIFLLAWLVVSFMPQIRASHSMGAEFYYFWVSDSTYSFTLVFYRNCTGFTATAPSTVDLIGTSVSTGKNFTKTMVMLPIFGTNVPPLNPPGVNQCAERFQNMCVEEYVYRTVVTLPGKARDWEFTGSGNFHIGWWEYDNIRFGFNVIKAGLNNLDFEDSLSKNISPVWHTRRPNIPGHIGDTVANLPIISLCEYRRYGLTQIAKEYQGDRLKYEIDTAWISSSLLSPYTSTYPLPTDTPPPLSIDSAKGVLYYNPIPSGISTGTKTLYGLGIKASEFRNDTDLIGTSYVVKEKRIGYVSRFLTFIISDSAKCPDSLFRIADTTNHKPTSFFNLACDDNPFEISFSFPIDIFSVDSNASCFLLINSKNRDTVPLIKAVPQILNSLPVYDVLIYTDSILDTGLYYLYVVQGDDGNTIISECGKDLENIKDSIEIYKPMSPNEPMFWATGFGTDHDTIDVDCRAQVFTLFTSNPIRCTTVSRDGSEFYLVDSSSSPINKIPITFTARYKCSKSYTQELELHTSKPIDHGKYGLYLTKGTDNNTILDVCHRWWNEPSIGVKAPGLEIDLGPDKEICKGDEINVVLKAPPGYTYKWSTGQFKDSITVTQYGTYWVQVWTNTGCLGTDTVNIVEINCTGIEDHSGEFGFSIRPNPVKEDKVEIVLERETNEMISLEVLSSQGSVISKIESRPSNQIIELNIGTLAPGIYFIRLNDGHSTGIQKLVRN